MKRIVGILRSIHIVQSPQLHPPVTPDMQRASLFLANEEVAQSPQLHPPVTPDMQRASLFLPNEEVTLSAYDDDLLMQVMRLSAEAVSAVVIR